MKNVLRTALCLLFMIVLTIPCFKVYAYTLPSSVRVGLEYRYKEVDSVLVSNTRIAVGFEYNGVFAAEALLESAAGFTVTVASSAYYIVYSDIDTYTQARSLADTNTTYIPAVASNGRWAVYSSSGAPERLLSAGLRVAIISGGKTVAIFDNSGGFPQIVDADGGFVILGDRKYRGAVEFGRYTGKKITAVNVIGLDEYLFSAVSSEMYSTWYYEALKAQAVASRSYAVTQMGLGDAQGVHSDSGYDICDKSHCQNYIGAGNEAQSTNAAVLETSGELVYYHDQPANAVFFSSSGGVTDNSENVWTQQLPYLRSVEEKNETSAAEWARSFTMDEITGLLTQNNISIGRATSVSIGSNSSSGRVSELIITGTSGTKSLYKEEIRNFFSSTAGGLLESRNFQIANGVLDGTKSSVSNSKVNVTNGTQSNSLEVTSINVLGAAGSSSFISSLSVLGATVAAEYAESVPIVITTSSGSGVTFIGRGWGHGVGMSQHGANGMAQMGYGYKEILEYYYTGTVVR